jgi:hypothetical protein
MKVSELIAIRPQVEKIAQKEMDMQSALVIAKFTRTMLEAIQEFEKKRADLFEKYGEKPDESGNIVVKEENKTKFQNAIKRALGKNIKIEPIDTKKLGLVIAPADLINCLSVFK